MRVITRVKRLRFSRKVCWAVIPVTWLVFFITLSLYNDREVAGKLLTVVSKRVKAFLKIAVEQEEVVITTLQACGE